MIKVEHFDGVNFTPAYQLSLRANLDILDAGFGEAAVNVGWSDQAVVGFVDGVPAGVIIWNHIEHLKQVFVSLGYVLPEFRGRGVYRAMWDKLIVKAREKNARSIYGITSVRNTAMRDAAKRLGRVEEGIVLTFKL